MRPTTGFLLLSRSLPPSGPLHPDHVRVPRFFIPGASIMPKTNKTAPKKAAEKNAQKRKAPYTNEEVLKKLYNTRDDALDWVEQCAAEKTGKGSSAALAIYERAQVVERRVRITSYCHAQMHASNFLASTPYPQRSCVARRCPRPRLVPDRPQNQFQNVGSSLA